MRPKTLILFFVAIGCGLVASIGVSQYMEKARENSVAPLETMKIYVACTEINIGEKLDEKNIKLEEWPKDRVPEGAISELKDLEDKYPRARMYTGEPILVAKLTDTVHGDTSQTIPEGFRVVAVKVDAETGLGGLIRPGDRVDVMVFLRKSSEVPETKTQTILRDVNVFAVDAETERAVDKGTGQAREVRNVSLLVKPNQAESIMLAKELGVMSLTLRRPNDTNDEASEGQTVQSLLGSEADRAGDRRPDSAIAGDPALRSWLNNAATQLVAPPVEPIVIPEPPVAEEPPKFVMKIRTSNGDREYRWKELDGEPIEMEARLPSQAPPAASPVPTQPVAYPAAPPMATPVAPQAGLAPTAAPPAQTPLDFTPAAEPAAGTNEEFPDSFPTDPLINGPKND